ncbi:MAG: hypothetical protein GTN83_03105, partial [Acidobacteria bacterium]|nr:hypothetical protein [Acidobacteriota bacterium]
MTLSHRATGQRRLTIPSGALETTLEDLRRIVFGSRRSPPLALPRVSLTTKEIQQTVNAQAATEAGFTLAAARAFAAQNGMTVNVGFDPGGSL